MSPLESINYIFNTKYENLIKEDKIRIAARVTIDLSLDNCMFAYLSSFIINLPSDIRIVSGQDLYNRVSFIAPILQEQIKSDGKLTQEWAEKTYSTFRL